MNIVSLCDEGYLPHYAALLHSASLFHPDAHYWVLGYDLTPEGRDKIAGFAASRNLSLTVVNDLGVDLAGLRIRKNKHYASYAKFLVSDVLPESAQRALFIDADATVTDSLADLFAIDMQGLPAAAVKDIPAIGDSEKINLGLPEDATYCNSGVILMDLEIWRREKLGQQLLAFTRDNPEFGANFMDQTAFNKLLANRILVLPVRWNFTNFIHIEQAPSPAIVHYAGGKPWKREKTHFQDLYLFHRLRTPWPFQPPRYTRKQVRTKVKRWIGSLIGVPERFAIQAKQGSALRKRIAVPALERARRMVAGGK